MTTHHSIIYLIPMADPVKAKDVLIKFLSGSTYLAYGCASEVETEFTMETKSVKTIGDGNWSRERGQKKSQVVNISGMVIVDAGTPDIFDLLDYFKQMVDVGFEILFIDNTGVAKVLAGVGLPISVSLTAGSEGFATGSASIKVNGDPDAQPSSGGGGGGGTPVCVAEIATAHTELRGSGIQRRWVVIDSMVTGSADISRWDYTLDGGGTQSAFTPNTIPAEWILPLAFGIGTHTIVITPICDNGFSGTSFTMVFP